MEDVPPRDHAAAVLDALDEAAAALRAGDFARYAAVWAHEPWVSVVHPAEGEWLTGRASVGPAYEALLGSGARPNPERRVLSVRLSGAGDMAWVTAEGTVRPHGAPILMWQTFVLERRAGRWLLVHAHASVPALSVPALPAGDARPPSEPAR